MLLLDNIEPNFASSKGDAQDKTKEMELFVSTTALDTSAIITDKLLEPSSISTSASTNVTTETNASSLTSSSRSSASPTKTDPSRLARIYWVADRTTLPASIIRVRAHNVARKKIREIIKWHDFHGRAFKEQDGEYVKWIRDYFEVEMWGYSELSRLFFYVSTSHTIIIIIYDKEIISILTRFVTLLLIRIHKKGSYRTLGV